MGQLLSAHETHNQYPLLTQSCSTNDSVGWLPVEHHLLVLLQRPQQQQQQQQQHVLLQHPVLLQYTLLQHPLSSKDNASTSSDILAAGSHATTAAAILIPGSTSTHMKVNVAANLGQKMSSVWAYFTKLHRRLRPRHEPGHERHAACVAETARRVSSVHPQRCQGFDPTFAQCIIFNCAPEAIGQKCFVRTYQVAVFVG